MLTLIRASATTLAMEIQTRHIKYVFADVVGFTNGRTVQAQIAIIGALNKAFKDAAGTISTVFLPTGDGLCAAITQPVAAPDAHLKLALEVMTIMEKWASEQTEYTRRCAIRFGINESVDCLYKDINGQENLLGAGINQCQRLMSAADGNQIMVGRAAYDNLVVWDEYVEQFRALRFEVKHGTVLDAFQYIGPGSSALNVGIPQIVAESDPIDLKLNEALTHVNSAGYARLLYEAVETWERVIEEELSRIAPRLDELQTTAEIPEGHSLTSHQASAALKKCQDAFARYLQKEQDFLGDVCMLVPGSMYRGFSADHALEIVRRRAKWLRLFSAEWLGLNGEH